MKPKASTPTKTGKPPSYKTARDMAIGLSMAKTEILSFQREVATQPEKFLSPFQTKPPQSKIPNLVPSNINEVRKATQDKILAGIFDRIEKTSEGTISKDDIENAIETRCITRTLSVLYAAVYQWKDQGKKLEILENAGETFEKKEGGTGTRAGGICHAFLRQNGLTKKIEAKDMAIELKAAFNETFNRVRGEMETEGFDINEGQLKRLLATELFRRTGGRSNKAHQISSAKDAARQFCERIEPEKASYLSLYQSAQMMAASNLFVETQVPKPLLTHLLENPLQPVYQRNQVGGTLLHPETGKPVLNPNLPEKWRKDEIPTEIELAYRALNDPTKKSEVGMLLDTLRLPRKINIPLNAALEGIMLTSPGIPLILQQAKIVEKTKLAYEITKGAHSLAYRLGIATAAAGERLLSTKEISLLEDIQEKINTFPEGKENAPLDIDKLALNNTNITETLERIDDLWKKSVTELDRNREVKTPQPELDATVPKTHEPIFEPIS